MTFDLGAGLKGKAVLVTGAAGGIGRETALAFAAAGARVAAVDLTQSRADAVVAEMEGGPHLAVGYDLRPVSGHMALIARVVEQFGTLDALVQTAFAHSLLAFFVSLLPPQPAVITTAIATRHPNAASDSGRLSRPAGKDSVTVAPLRF